MASARIVSPDLLASATELVADAFHENPAHVYICPESETRRQKLEWFLGRNLRAQLPGRSSFCLAEGGVVHAMGFWTRGNDPQDSEVGLLGLIRVGFLLAPFHLGLAGLLRMLEVADRIDAAASRSVDGHSYWYLHNLVIRKERRGEGIGHTLLREQLDWIASVQPGVRIVLATQRRENLRFYERLGFDVVAEDWIGKGEHAFRNWTMQTRARTEPTC